MSAIMISSTTEFPDKDAAMSLCEIGQPFTVDHCPCPSLPIEISPLSSDSESQDANSQGDVRSRSSSVDLDSDIPSIQTVHGNLSIGSLPPKKRTIEQQNYSTAITSTTRKSKVGREVRISYEEMKRLMRVYGPTKCLRNRTPKESGKNTKILSVKRKFYRWFPDFHKRFVLQDGGWYKPKMGHEEEMKYREELRRKDQEVLAAKRNAKTKKNGTDGVKAITS